MPHQALLLVLAILLAYWHQRGLVQEVQWPVHTICNTDKLQIFYRSCGELKATHYVIIRQYKNTGHRQNLKSFSCIKCTLCYRVVPSESIHTP
uniref:Secreted protein n=1 Tax=Hucho hucho TaxID=62062 RepID=A0A4W5QNZ4_9TELE